MCGPHSSNLIYKHGLLGFGGSGAEEEQEMKGPIIAKWRLARQCLEQRSRWWTHLPTQRPAPRRHCSLPCAQSVRLCPAPRGSSGGLRRGGQAAGSNGFSHQLCPSSWSTSSLSWAPQLCRVKATSMCCPHLLQAGPHSVQQGRGDTAGPVPMQRGGPSAEGERRPTEWSASVQHSGKRVGGPLQRGQPKDEAGPCEGVRNGE